MDEGGDMQLEISMAAETLFHIGPLPVTNTILTTWIVMAVLVILSILATRRMRLVPTGLQNAIEALVEVLLNLVEAVAGKELGRKIFPLIGTLFIFILTANWMGLLPGVGSTIYLSAEHHGELARIPLLRPANSDFNTTIAMALITVFLVQVVGVRAHGFFGYLKELASPLYMSPLFFPIHIISEISHALSLSARLFGNIFGGDVVLAVIFGFIPWIAPAAFLGLEMLFGLIQAIIFSLLSLVYFSLAAASHGPEH